MNPAAANIARNNRKSTVVTSRTKGIAAKGRLRAAQIRNKLRRESFVRSASQPQTKQPNSHPNGGIHRTLPMNACVHPKGPAMYNDDAYSTKPRGNAPSA